MNSAEYAVHCSSAFEAGTKAINKKIVCARKKNKTKEISVLEEIYAFGLILQHVMPSNIQSDKQEVSPSKVCLVNYA